MRLSAHTPPEASTTEALSAPYVLSGHLARLELQDYWRPILAVVLCTAFYWPSLRFGFFYDDFWILQQSLETAHTMHLARPAWLLSTLGLAQVSTDPFFQRFASLVCFDLIAILGFQLLARSTSQPLLVLLVLLSHPWFVYPVTWISQRADLLWLVFVILALTSRSTIGSTVWSILSLLAKTPFIIHGLLLARRLRIQKNNVSALLVLVAFAAVVAASYFMVLGQHVISDEHAAGGFHSIKHSLTSTWGLLAAMMLAGSAKIAESIVLMFIPFPATYGTGPAFWSVCLGYLLAWCVASWLLFREHFARVNVLWLMIGGAASLSFVFTAQLRAIAPAGFFIIAALLAGLPASRRSTIALATLLCLNLLSSIALYRATDTGCYDLHQPGAYESCREGPSLPYQHWGEYRHRKTDEIAGALKTILDAH
jgi:hypothetical protein